VVVEQQSRAAGKRGQSGATGPKQRDSQAKDLYLNQEEEMRNLLLTGLLMVACCAWVAAQTGSGSSGSSSGSTGSSGTSTSSQSTGSSGSQAGTSGTTSTSSDQSSMGSSANSTSIKGCLRGSSGNYSLTDDAGTTYQLQGDDSKLSKHVGEEVEVKGSEGAAGSSSSSGMSPSSSAGSTSGASAGKSFNVTGVKKVSSTCTSSKSK
jgi:hypothetical protein